MNSSVDLHVDHNVAEVTLSRPQRRNALSLELLGELLEAIDHASDRAGAIVISGAGGAFTAGADLDDLTGTKEDERVDAAVAEVAHALRDVPIPVMAAVEGPCVGAGIVLLLACDLRLAAPEATFRLPAIALGLLYDPYELRQLTRRIGVDALRRLLLVPDEWLTAAAAARSGLVSDVVDGPVEVARGWARSLARCAPDVIRANKRFLLALEIDEPVELEPWDGVRRRFLDGPARRAAVEAVQRDRSQRQDES